ncbi:DUF7331 family protein [Natronobacterium gregoryi]|uniref:Uncharacterized protein n=2 Tax=Natronobacterium gregoryi TaxID=44930 RepID=L0AFA0_NATGS|nr:hypothetical protein [Natronobacterium gregoryi]AFZ71817.1 hypothetical protein Natgr_0567 [Natronobacterium gregoryi SP2]ELY72952.1 hypothetical protein C490_02196 [Natronobacterium gregoryi SP2]PLK21003.1 hypothetical protein CYV19_06095 [Natronobacterium gregoryi SP2]SFI87153.1 hypothetical protein SAMN05443661_1084 [Natronobacterium gregoryi]
MIDVSSPANDDETMDRREPSSAPEGTATIESYETDDGVVFYDAENPLAWMETSRTLVLEELA